MKVIYTFTENTRSMAKTYIGIDLGSTTVKAVALNERVLASAIKPTGANPRKTGKRSWSRFSKLLVDLRTRL